MAVLAAATLWAGCSSGDDSATETTPVPSTTLAPTTLPSTPTTVAPGPPDDGLGLPVPSPIEGVPVPETAIFDEELSAPDESTLVFGFAPQSVAVPVLDGWLTENLPDGAALGPWQWCHRARMSSLGQIQTTRFYLNGTTSLAMLIGRGILEPSAPLRIYLIRSEDTPCPPSPE
ncbi:hypothetical protein BH20ACT2_BH20ACT2_10920 [soil metagenome]